MILGLDRNLYILEAITKLYRSSHNIKTRFDLKRETPFSDVIASQFGDLSTDESPIAVKVMDVRPYHYLSFGFFDKEKDDLLTVFHTGDILNVNVNTLFIDWAILVPDSNEYSLYNKDTGDGTVITREFGEDEHFQMMMNMSLPDFADIQKLWTYIDTTKNSLDVHRFSHSIDYKKLDIDLTGVVFRDDIFDTIADELSNSKPISKEEVRSMLITDANCNSTTSFTDKYIQDNKWHQ